VVALPGSFRLAFSIHHAVVDGWSYARLIVDLLTLYDAALAGVPDRLPELPDGLAQDFVVAERAAATSPEAAAFWQTEADAPGLLAERSRFGPAATSVADLELTLDTAALDRLRGAARLAGTSLKCYVQGAFGWALGEWAGRDRDVVMGCAVSTRPERAGADLVVGLYLSTVPVRFASTRGTWAELARAAAAAERRALPHLRHPLVQVEQRLGRPAFDVSFNFAHFHVYRDLAALTRIRPGERWVAGKPGFPVILDFAVDDAESAARTILEYDRALVDAPRADRLAVLCREALDAAGRDPFRAGR
jgi:condensation domain-containing protein